MVTLEALEKIRKETKQLLIINIAIGLVGSILHKSIIGIVLIVVAVIFFLLVVNTKMNRYKLLFKENIVKASLSGIFSELDYNSESGISIEEVKNSELITLKDVFESNDLITAKYGNVRFKQSDIIIKDTSNHMNQDGQINQRSEQASMARLLIFDFLKATKATVSVMGKNYKSGGENQGILVSLIHKVDHFIKDNQVKLESELFNQNFRTYSADTESAFYVLTPQMIDAITMLSDHYNGKIAFSFKNEKMFVAIVTAQDSLESKVLSNRTIWNERDLVLKDIKVITDFIDRMKLEQNTLVASAN